MGLAEHTILIVDDEKDNRKILKELLGNEANIIFAKNGAQAITLAGKHLPDLILLDVVMPDFTGFEVIEKLKDDPVTMHIAVIFITGLANSDDEEKGFALGGCDYIYKPFKPGIVNARVLMHLQLIKQQKLLSDIAHVDALTGLANRRKMDLVFNDEVVRAKKQHTALLVALLDVDFFKQYNDNYGHGAGDLALKKIANVLDDNLSKPRNFVARYGGEEFMVILPETDLSQAKLILAHLFQQLHECCIKHDFSGVSDRITMSIGAVLANVSDLTCVGTLLKQADELLYQAKRNGRNQLAIDTSSE